MALTTYSLSLDWSPDQTHINAAVGLSFLAWRIGVDLQNKKGLWLIAEVRTPPTVALSTLLPAENEEDELLDDTTKYGFLRSVEPSLSVGDLESSFSAEVAQAQADITAGYR